MCNEREWLFFSFLIILSMGYAALALVSWRLHFHAGLLVNGLALLALLTLGGLRRSRVSLKAVSYTHLTLPTICSV